MHIRTWHHSKTEHIFLIFLFLLIRLLITQGFFFFPFFFSFFKVRNENQQGLCVVGFGGASQEKNEPTLGFPALR